LDAQAGQMPEAIVEGYLDSLLFQVENSMDGDAISFCGPITYGADDLVREEIEDIRGKRSRLIVILETNGGYIEVAQRLADTFRHHYNIVEFVVPNYAMSAGTVLVMSGDAIHMDYYSILGPIDPQTQKAGGQFIPALGYLEKYNTLIEKSYTDDISAAEVAYLIAKFDPAEMYQFEQARELSISLLKEWLVKYKFKDWHKTETRGVTVTQKMKQQRAQMIAKILNRTDRWHTHGRGISMHVLRNELNLRIEDFEEGSHGASVKEYYRLLKSYMMRRGWEAVFHRNTKCIPLSYMEGIAP